MSERPALLWKEYEARRRDLEFNEIKLRLRKQGAEIDCFGLSSFLVKGGPAIRFELGKPPIPAMRRARSARCARLTFRRPIIRPAAAIRAACSLTEGEAALFLARFYMSPPANPGRTGF
jgi:hypothetical protein